MGTSEKVNVPFFKKKEERREKKIWRFFYLSYLIFKIFSPQIVCLLPQQTRRREESRRQQVKRKASHTDAAAVAAWYTRMCACPLRVQKSQQSVTSILNTRTAQGSLVSRVSFFLLLLVF